MPTDKFTRLIRARMEETGESFQTARQALIDLDVALIEDHSQHILSWRSDDPEEFPDFTMGLTLFGRAGVIDAVGPDVPILKPMPNTQEQFRLTPDGSYAYSHAELYPVEPDTVLRHLSRLGDRPDGMFGVSLWVESTDFPKPLPKGTAVIAAVAGNPNESVWVSNHFGKLSIRPAPSARRLGGGWDAAADAMTNWINDRAIPDVGQPPAIQALARVLEFCETGPPVFDLDDPPPAEIVGARSQMFLNLLEDEDALHPMFSFVLTEYARVVLHIVDHDPETFDDYEPAVAMQSAAVQQALQMVDAFPGSFGPDMGPQESKMTLLNIAAGGCYGPLPHLAR